MKNLTKAFVKNEIMHVAESACKATNTEHNRQTLIETSMGINSQVDRNALKISSKTSNADLKARCQSQFESIVTQLPTPIQAFMSEAFWCQRIPKEFLFSSILFAFSCAIGKAFALKASSYTNYANLYWAICGSRGDGKSPAMELATQPLRRYDTKFYKEALEHNMHCIEESNKIKRKQLLLQDATIEAAIEAHAHNPYSIGVYIDEMHLLFEKFASKNSDGAAWKSFLLQGNTNKHIDVQRKVSKSYRLDLSYPTVLGSIQNQLIYKMFENGNLESGIIDRFLFTHCLVSNTQLNENEINPHTVAHYDALLSAILDQRITLETQEACMELTLSDEAGRLLLQYRQDLLDRQSESMPNEFEYYSKMHINIHKITLLLHLILNSNSDKLSLVIPIETLRLGIEVLEFYYTNFLITLNLYGGKQLEISEDQIIYYAFSKGKRQCDVYPLLDLHKSSISRKWHKIESMYATCNSRRNTT